MIKKGIILILFVLLFLQGVLASVSFEDLEKEWDVKEGGLIKVSSKQIEIRLMKDGTLYKEINNLILPEEKGFIIFLLPEGRSYYNLEIYDLKTRNKDRLVEYNDIKTINNCSDYYSIKKINDTYTILVCPDYKNKEIEIEIDTILYNDQIPKESKKQVDYGIYFSQITAAFKETITRDFKMRFSISAEKDIWVDLDIRKTYCSIPGMEERLGYNTFICEGYPKIEGQLVFDKVSIFGKDKEKKD